MSRELILMPKAKYELLTQENHTENTHDRKPCRDVQTVDTSIEEPQIDVLEKTLTYAIPKNGHRKAMGLWNYIKYRKGTVLNWNDNGEVAVHGKTIPDSHLIDLLKYTVTAMSKREPTGYRSFYEALREMHTPSEFMAYHHHQSGSGFFVRGKTDRGPPGTKTGKNNFRSIPY